MTEADWHESYAYTLADIDKIVRSFEDHRGRIDRNDNVRAAVREHIRGWWIAHSREADRCQNAAR